MKLHHVAYLVKKIEKSKAAFESLGYEAVSLCGGDVIVNDTVRNCDICFMVNKDKSACDDEYVELVSPQGEESPIYGLLSKYKNGPYHLCFSTDEPEEKIEELKGKGWVVINEEEPAPAFGDNYFVVFLLHRFAGMIELAYVK